MSCKAAFNAVAKDYVLWRELYLANEPLAPKDFRKRLLKDTYCDHRQLLGKETGLQFSVWMRTSCLLYRKPRLVLVLGGKDPVLVRRLGQAESAMERVHLGINYHLDSYLDEDESRFAVEFPQLFQDLDPGDIVVTQDYRGAGCWTVLPAATPNLLPAPCPESLTLPTPPGEQTSVLASECHAGPAPQLPTTASGTSSSYGVEPCVEGYVLLRKNEYDSSGYGILTLEVAPPAFPLFYFCEEQLTDVGLEGVDRAQLAARQVYWYGYSRLRDGGLFSWADLQICDDV